MYFKAQLPKIVEEEVKPGACAIEVFTDMLWQYNEMLWSEKDEKQGHKMERRKAVRVEKGPEKASFSAIKCRNLLGVEIQC